MRGTYAVTKTHNKHQNSIPKQLSTPVANGEVRKWPNSEGIFQQAFHSFQLGDNINTGDVIEKFEARSQYFNVARVSQRVLTR